MNFWWTIFDARFISDGIPRSGTFDCFYEFQIILLTVISKQFHFHLGLLFRAEIDCHWNIHLTIEVAAPFPGSSIGLQENFVLSIFIHKLHRQSKQKWKRKRFVFTLFIRVGVWKLHSTATKNPLWWEKNNW